MSTDNATCAAMHPIYEGVCCTKQWGHRGVHGHRRHNAGRGFDVTWPQTDTSAEAGPLADIVVNPALLQNATLPQRMRAAAHALVDANIRHDTDAGVPHKQATSTAPTIPWDAKRLLDVADRWEIADQEQAEKAAWQQELSARLAELLQSRWSTDHADTIAAALIADGWTKGHP